MASTRLAEHLLILEQHSVGLLNRAYNLVSFQGPAYNNPDLEKFAHKLGKEFPKAANKLKVSSTDRGFDLFQQRSTEISSSLKDFYYTFYDVAHYNEKCLNVFREVQPLLHALDIEVNPQFFKLFFSFFTNWIKLHIIMARCCAANHDNIKTFVQCYSRAHFLVTGNTEPKFNDVAGYIIDWYGKPTVYQKLRSMLDPHVETGVPNISAFVGAALLSAHKMLKGYCESHHTLQQRGLLSIVDKSEEMLSHKNENVHMQLLLLPQLKEWAIFGYMACPAELVNEQAQNTLLLALSDFVVMPLYRDLYIDIHSEVNDLYEDYRINTLKFKLSKFKTPARAITETYQQIVGRHLFFRRYLATELDSMSKFIRISYSGVTIAPKISMILALLRLSVAEIDWYYIHRHAIIQEELRPYKAPGRFTIPFDPVVSDLIHHVLAIRDVLLKHTARYVDGEKPLSVAAINTEVPQQQKVPSAFLQYYVKFLQQDVASMKNLLMTLPTLSDPARSTLETVITALEGVEQTIDHDGLIQSSFANLRNNLHRLNVLFITKTTFSPLPPQVPAFLGMFQNVMYHTQFLDGFDLLLFQEIVPFKNMIWFLPLMERDLITLTAGISGTVLQPGSPPPAPSRHAKNCVSLVRTLSDATFNVHKVCPEELPILSLRAATAIDKFLNHLTKTVCDGLSLLVKFYLQLRRGVSSLYAINLLQCDPKEIKLRSPGLESDLYDNTHPVDYQHADAANINIGINFSQPSSLRQSATFALAAQMCRIRSIRVYTYDLSPREYLTTALQAQIRFLVRSQVVPKLTDPNATSMNPQVDEELNTADPDATIKYNAEHFAQIAQHQRQLGMLQEGPKHQIRRPSLLLIAILNVLYLFHDLDRECNIGMGEICRLIMTTEFTGVYQHCGGEQIGSVTLDASQEGSATTHGPQLKTPILTYICNWYMNLFSRDFEPMNTTYNEMLDVYDGYPLGFDKRINDYRYSAFYPHLYTDPTELRVLVLLTGPRGVEFFNKHILTIVEVFTRKVFDIITKNINLLQQVRGRYTEPQVWLSAAEQLVEKDELLQYLAVVGNALQFRSMLSTCLKNLVQEQLPLVADILSQSVQVAQTFVDDYMFDSRIIEVKRYAESAAQNDFIMCDDLQLKEALRRLKNGPQDSRAWSLLPEAIGLSLYANTPFMQRTKYLTSSEGFNNNLHLVTQAARDLIGVFTALPEETRSITPNAPELIKAELRRFLRVAAFCVVTLPSSIGKPSTPENLILLEKYVDATSGTLTMSMLEPLVPAGLIRSQYIHQLEQSQDSTKMMLASDE